ncbi:hypothetical protein D3C84_863650 [compost metagenome]
MTLPVELLLSGIEKDLDTLAQQVRQRLQEVHQTLHVDVPVYLVLSKADQLLGFDEFFDQLTREESDQVLGASFGQEQSGTDVAVLRQEFEALCTRSATPSAVVAFSISHINWGRSANTCACSSTWRSPVTATSAPASCAVFT